MARDISCTGFFSVIAFAIGFATLLGAKWGKAPGGEIASYATSIQEWETSKELQERRAYFLSNFTFLVTVRNIYISTSTTTPTPTPDPEYRHGGEGGGGMVVPPSDTYNITFGECTNRSPMCLGRLYFEPDCVFRTHAVPKSASAFVGSMQTNDGIIDGKELVMFELSVLVVVVVQEKEKEKEIESEGGGGGGEDFRLIWRGFASNKQHGVRGKCGAVQELCFSFNTKTEAILGGCGVANVARYELEEGIPCGQYGDAPQVSIRMVEDPFVVSGMVTRGSHRFMSTPTACDEFLASWVVGPTMLLCSLSCCLCFGCWEGGGEQRRRRLQKKIMPPPPRAKERKEKRGYNTINTGRGGGGNSSHYILIN